MTKEEWIINIENTAAEAASIYGKDVMGKVLRKYGASTVAKLPSSNYEAVFGELFQMAADK